MTRVTSQALNTSYVKDAGRGTFSGTDGADVTWHGRLFQVQAAATGKARSPIIDSPVYSGQAVMWSTMIVGGF